MSWPSGVPSGYGDYCSECGAHLDRKAGCPSCGLTFGFPDPLPPPDFLETLRLVAIAAIQDDQHQR